MYNNEDNIWGNLPYPLSSAQTKELILEFNNGSKKSMQKLVIHNIRLVIYEINKIKTIDFDKSDLLSTGIIGLLKAIKTFDLTKNTDFSTYATRCIDNEVFMLLKKQKKEKNTDSIDRIMINNKNGDEFKLLDLISDNKDLIEYVETKELINNVRSMMRQLPNRDREIIKLYFGFYKDKRYTQDEIAHFFNISRAYVSILIKKTLSSMRLQIEENKSFKIYNKK